MRFAVGIALICLIAADVASAGSRVFVATAPEGIHARMLGRPYDHNFERVTGEAGRSLFPAGKVHTDKAGTFRSTRQTIEDTSSLRANARAWVIDVNATSSAKRRYASYRAYYLTQTESLDDASKMRSAPEQGVYYLSKIYYGHMHEFVVFGDFEEFDSSAQTAFLKWGAGIRKFTQSNDLRYKRVLRGGFEPDAEVLLDDSKLADRYKNKKFGAARPILVEFTRIGGRKDPQHRPINWKPTKTNRDIESFMVQVDGGNSAFSDSGSQIRKGDLINVIAFGEVRLGGFSNSRVGPGEHYEGRPTNGHLNMYIGPKRIPVGSNFAYFAKTAGRVRFRIQDSDHSDNTGEYGVLLTILRNSAKPPCRHAPQNNKDFRRRLERILPRCH